jgi:hypothetical protein
MDELLDKTLDFFLRGIARELSKDIDWRARGHGRNVFVRASIYTAAMVRDLIRIPLHHPAGIAQSRFRARVAFISERAIPILAFFRANYPIQEHRKTLIDEAIEVLERGVSLISDGAYPKLDEWYATMEEFHSLSEYSQQAATIILAVVELEPVADS